MFVCMSVYAKFPGLLSGVGRGIPENSLLLRHVVDIVVFQQLARAGGLRPGEGEEKIGLARLLEDRLGNLGAGGEEIDHPGPLLLGVPEHPVHGGLAEVEVDEEGLKMGMHQDKDEGDLRWPVLSISLGDDALFRVGGTARGGPTERIWLQSGDVALLAGEARLAYHGIDRIRFRSSNLLPDGGRLNVTLRVAG